jgi:ribosome-associated protein
MTRISEKKQTEKLVDAIVHGLQEVKGNDIVVMDLEKIPNAICSRFIICHGDSNVQVEALANSVEKEVKKLVNEKPIHREGVANAEWIILDYFNVVVHVFQRSTREFYDLERLWADAKVTAIDYQI